MFTQPIKGSRFNCHSRKQAWAPAAKPLNLGEGAGDSLLIRALPLLTTSTTTAQSLHNDSQRKYRDGWGEKQCDGQQIWQTVRAWQSKVSEYQPALVLRFTLIKKSPEFRSDNTTRPRSCHEKQATSPPYLPIPTVCASKNHFARVILQSLSADCRVHGAGCPLAINKHLCRIYPQSSQTNAIFMCRLRWVFVP